MLLADIAVLALRVAITAALVAYLWRGYRSGGAA